MMKKLGIVTVRGESTEIAYVATDDGDVEEWSVVDSSLENTLSEEDCVWIDAQLYELENGEPVYPQPTLKL